MRVLVVEDEPRMATLVKLALEEDGGVVDLAFNANEGRYMAGNALFDLIILDIIMPDGSGLDICRELREKRVATPILLLTCKSGKDDKIEGLNSGADDYLTKPFDIGELLARVHALLRRNKELTSDRLQVAELVMETLSRQVWYKQKLLELTAKEYGVLLCLMRHPNITLSRTQLEQHVWNQEFEGSTNLVSVYIQRLRQKLGVEGGRLIHTVHGMGYRLVA
jgi:two-component system, OmpR family, copper resistance phosphate regulon response regulator CusR